MALSLQIKQASSKWRLNATECVPVKLSVHINGDKQVESWIDKRRMNLSVPRQERIDRSSNVHKCSQPLSHLVSEVKNQTVVLHPYSLLGAPCFSEQTSSQGRWHCCLGADAVAVPTLLGAFLFLVPSSVSGEQEFPKCGPPIPQHESVPSVRHKDLRLVLLSEPS